MAYGFREFHPQSAGFMAGTSQQKCMAELRSLVHGGLEAEEENSTREKSLDQGPGIVLQATPS